MDGSLRGLKVIDLTASVAGPFATQILGDLGADVIKIERVAGGDDTRRWGPPFWGGESPMFLALNRNKRSLALELKTDEGREVLTRLIADGDVLVQNLRPGALARLGFGQRRLREINPRLVYCEMSGYGPTGALRDRPAYDPLMQAYSGLMSITGEAGRTPVRIPASLLDQGTAMWAVIGILDALRVRESTGEGSYVHTSLLQTALMWMPSQITGYFADGQRPGKWGSGTGPIAPYQAFPTADGYFVVAAGNDNLWRKMCRVIGRTDLIDDPWYVDNPSRVAHRDALADTLSETFRERPTAEWEAALTEAGVPATAIKEIDEVVADEQVKATGMLAPADHPHIPDFTVINTPINRDGHYFSGPYPGTPVPPPRLGEHTEQILAELGYGEAEIGKLVGDHVAGTAGTDEEAS